MTTPIQHDPRTKQQIKDALYEYLYAPVKKQFTNRLHTIIDQNCVLGGYPHRSFVYKGELYNNDTSPPPRKANRLVQQMVPVMQSYLADLHKLNTEELPFVLGYINQVLNASNNFPDYLHLLPDSVHGPVYKMLVTCPCNARQLTDAEIEALRQKNAESIQLIKQRMMMNLII